MQDAMEHIRNAAPRLVIDAVGTDKCRATLPRHATLAPLQPPNPRHRIAALRIQRARIDAELRSLGQWQADYALDKWWSEDAFNEAVAKLRAGTEKYEVEVIVDLTGLREGEDVPLRFKGYDAEGMAYEADGTVHDVGDRKMGAWSVVRKG